MSKSDQKKDEQAKIPKGRLSRFAKMGSLATRVAGNMLAEGASQLAQGNRPKVKDLLLTPGNAMRVAEQLAQLRGAAMKIGQLLSMDAGDMLPKELTDLLSRLRSDAKSMPVKQLQQLLTAEWGPDWQQSFLQFPLEPIAAASIGQVHKAITKDFKRLAIKIQYPGIRQSINSDVDNVASLIKLSGLLPKKIDIKPLLAEAKQQLHDEADYILEGQRLEQYAHLIEGDEAFIMPRLDQKHSTTNILAMTFVDGIPIEELVSYPQELRNKVMTELMRLFFKELFEFKLVQTDPNFANYQYDPDNDKVVLLDFGATRQYKQDMADNYFNLMVAAISNNQAGIQQAALDIGLISPSLPDPLKGAITEMCYQSCEPLYAEGVYDFGSSDLLSRLREQGMALGLDKNFVHTPPANSIFLHRKIGGLCLLAIKLKARVDVKALFSAYL